MTKIAIGIDIGGTNTAWGVVDEAGNMLHHGKWSTRDHAEPVDLVTHAIQDFRALFEAHPDWTPVGMGIGAPNGNFFNGTIEYAPNLDWEGIVPLRDLFQAHFEVPIWVTNDANAAAVGEQLFGCAKGHKDFLVVTLGTGVGSGFVVNGQLVYGHDGFAGELGHVTVERNGRLCGCGRRGCLETYASATGIVWTAKERLATYEGDTLIRDLPTLSAKGLADCANEGDALALEIFDYTGAYLGFALANATAITSPDLIVLYGGLALAGDLILEPTKRYMEDHMLNLFKNKVSLKCSTVPHNDAAILGAAALVWQ